MLVNLLFACPSDFGSAQRFPHKQKPEGRESGRNMITFYTAVLALRRVMYAQHVNS